MAGHTLTTAATLMCPHLGKVTIMGTNARVRAASVPAALVTDSYTISGCLAGSCLTVRWIVPDVRVKVGAAATLSRSSVGLCLNALQIPQGPVFVLATQPRVSTQ
jgi:hypothetical protein